ncbi:MAG: hypothetical protein HQK51_00550 [Oligoflexia bacterium]|nr:hypothetical protein [Oligoflexia bacterium]
MHLTKQASESEIDHSTSTIAIEITEDQDNIAALILEDLSCANDISYTLKELNIFPYVFRDIDEYLTNLTNFSPFISIIDIKKFFDKKNIFENHSFFNNNENSKKNNVIFYYDDKCKQLLSSISNLNHSGVINRNDNLLLTLKFIVLHLKDEAFAKNNLEKTQKDLSKQNSDNKYLRKHIKVLETENNLYRNSNSVITLINQEYDKLKYSLYANNIPLETKNKIPLSLEKSIFIEFLSNLLEKVEFIEKYSLLSYHDEDGKLLSTLPSPANSKKFFPFPINNIKCFPSSKIDNNAQNKILSMAIQIVGESCWMFNLSGHDILIDLAIVIKPTNKNAIDWTLIENYLNNIYSNISYIVKKIMSQTLDPSGININFEKSLTQFNFIRPWEFLSSIENKNDKIHNETIFICVDFKPLLLFINDHYYCKFFWRHFIDDFFRIYKKNCQLEFKISYIGVNIFILLVNKNLETIFLDKFYKYIKAFSYNKYFEDSSVFSHQYVFPEISILTSFTRKDYLRLLNIL